MARPLRLEYAGAIYHVTARGNERRAIFRSNRDRLRFLEKLVDLARVHHVQVYAYALMTNHYHFVLCTPRANLCAFMQQFNTSYTMYFNRRHSRTGHLFAGRYKAKLVEGGEYLLQLSRYLHLNPVKIKRLRTLPVDEQSEYLRKYRWSSYRSYAGLVPPSEWLTHEPLTAFGGQDSDDSRTAYQDYVEELVGRDDDDFQRLLSRSSKALGGAAFCSQIENRFREARAGLATSVDISRRRIEFKTPILQLTKTVLDVYGLEESDLFGRGHREAKDMWMRLTNEVGGLTQRQIGKRLGYVDGVVVSRRLAHLSRAMSANERLACRYRDLMAAASNLKALYPSCNTSG